MKILLVGADTRGSWQMRGVQLGQALGAVATVKPTRADWRWADVVVLVKRAAIMYEHAVKDAKGVPILWDVLDFWNQPDDNDYPVSVVTALVNVKRDRLGATAIGATERMASDIDGVYLPHHCRLGLTPTPPRDKARVVGYDGTRKYLGAWLAHLDRTCARLGLTFALNPADLSSVDVLVSFRDGRWDGAVCRQWKSGVKYVNAISAGRPILSQPAAARDELAPVGMTLDHPDGLAAALDYVTQDAVREQAYLQGLARASTFTVESVAAQYRGLIQQALRVAA